MKAKNIFRMLINLFVNLLLFVLAPFLELLLMPINVAVVFATDWKKRGFKSALKGISNYFRESAYRKDVYLCEE